MRDIMSVREVKQPLKALNRQYNSQSEYPFLKMILILVLVWLICSIMYLVLALKAVLEQYKQVIIFLHMQKYGNISPSHVLNDSLMYVECPGWLANISQPR